MGWDRPALPPAIGQSFIFGPGLAGDVHMDGTTSVLTGNPWDVNPPAAGLYLTNNDIYCRNLTIDAGAAVDLAGDRLFVSGTLTLNGQVQVGPNGSGLGQDPAKPFEKAPFAAAGVGEAPGGSPFYGGFGGNGGSGGSGTSGAGGAGGTMHVWDQTLEPWSMPFHPVSLLTSTMLSMSSFNNRANIDNSNQLGPWSSLIGNGPIIVSNIAAASKGTTVTAVLAAGLVVASTAAFPPFGFVSAPVNHGAEFAVFFYTGTSGGNTFTGLSLCSLTSGSAIISTAAIVRAIAMAYTPLPGLPIGGGAPGGSGAGDGVNVGGPAGYGGGNLTVFANRIVGTGTFAVPGGAGGTPASGNCGGGGGGGGGDIFIVSNSVVHSGAAYTPPNNFPGGLPSFYDFTLPGISFNVAGGAGGSGVGSGTNGSAGTSGSVFLLPAY